MSIERLQKILAQAGIASRRKAEELIEQGLVTVNGNVAKLGDKADFTADHIKVEGKLLRKLEDLFYVVFNKPKGVISMMSDPEGRPTIADYLAKMKAHVQPIGRLDFNSEGLLLLTNDGALAEKIQKSDAFPRIYHVKIKGHITTEMISRLERGGRVGEKFAKPLSVRIHEELNKKTKIEIVFVNAANVDVKAYFETKGFLVEKITRTGFGHLTLAGLEPGKFRVVPKTKFEALFTQPELGVKAIEHRHAKEREILPRDQRLRNVDEFGRVIPKVGTADKTAEKSATKIASKTKAEAPAATSGTKGDRIVVRATGDLPAAPKAGARKSYSANIDLPKFKKRTSASAGRGPRPDRGDRSERSSGPRIRSRSDSSRIDPRGEGAGGKRPMTRFGERKEGGFGGAKRGFGDKRPSGGFGGGRGEKSRSSSPRRESGDRPAFGRRDGKPRFSPRGEGAGSAPRSEGRAGFSRRPIARVKRRER